jgi:tape measure domain-containing protein
MSAIAKLWAEIGGDVSGFDRALKHVDSGMHNLERSAGRSAGGIDQVFNTAFGFALGSAVVNGIGAIAGGIVDMGRQAIDVVGNFERLEFSLNNMIAAEIQENFKDAGQGVLSMADAMEQAGAKTTDLTRWMEELAIKSPFAMKDVSESFRYAMTFFGKTDKAKRMTKATMDYSSVLGLTGFEMSKIIMNLGQMHSMNKLNTRDIMELSRLGMPVYKILADQFGTTEEAIIKMNEDGLLPAQDAIEAIVAYMEGRAGGAADQMANSISGLVSSLGDMKEFGLRDLFTPVFEAIRPSLAGLVDWFLKPETRQAIKDFGGTIGDAFTGMIALIDTSVVPALSRFWEAYQQKGVKGVAEVIGADLEATWAKQAEQIDTQTTALETAAADQARQKRLKQLGTTLGGLVGEGLLSFIRGDTVPGEGFWATTAIDNMLRAIVNSIAVRIETFSATAGEIWITFVQEFAKAIGKPLDSKQSAALNDNFKLLFNALDPVDLAGYVWQIISGGLLGSARLGTSLGQLLSRDSGGWIPGAEGKPRLMIGHGQEYVMPSNQARTISNNYNFDMTVNTRATSSTVIQDYHMLRSLVGAT